MSEYLKNHEMMTAVQQCGTVNEQKNSGLIPREWLAVSRLRNGPLTAVHNNGRPEHFGDARQPSAMQKNSVARSLATREKKKTDKRFVKEHGHVDGCGTRYEHRRSTFH